MPPGDAAIVHISSTRSALERCSRSPTLRRIMLQPRLGCLACPHAQAISQAGRVRVNAVVRGWIDTSGRWMQVLCLTGT